MAVPYRTFKIGGIEIPLKSGGPDLRQSYSTILDGIGADRMADGSLLIQQAWPEPGQPLKLRSTISGGGLQNVAFDALAPGSGHLVECVESRRITHPTNPLSLAITLPSGRRSGGLYAPQGLALVDGELAATSIGIVGDLATLGAVAGATEYSVRYWPAFMARIVSISHDGSPWRAARSFTLEIEEI